MAVSAMDRFRFGMKARISLYERIAAFLESNIDIISTLKTIRFRYQKQKDFRAKVLNDWIQKMDRGVKFAEAIKEWVPPAEYMLISAGERGVGIVDGLKEAVTLSQASSKSKSAIIGGTLMPLILSMLLGLMLIGFQLQMVPVFEGLLPIAKWPDGAKFLESLSRFVLNFWWVMLLGAIILAVVISKTIGSWTGMTRNKFDMFPPWSIYKTYQASSFLISLSSLMRSGIPNYDALKIMSKQSSPWLRSHLEKMMSKMKMGGATPGEALNTGLLDDEMAGDVEDYSRLGSFQDAIYTLGVRSLEESVEKVAAKMSIMKNILLVVVTGCVIWIYGTSYGLQTKIAEDMQRSSSR